MANELSTDKQAKGMRNKDNIKKHLKRAAIGLAAGATLAAAPGVVGGVKNVKAENLNRQKAAQEYQMSQKEINDKQNEMAKKIRDTGIEVDEGAKEIAQKTKKKAKELKDKAVEKINNLREETTVNYFPY